MWPPLGPGKQLPLARLMSSLQEKNFADTISAGFDYQWGCFILLALKLKWSKGAVKERIVFEGLDDIHIENADGTRTLIQVKHTVQKGARKNLTPSDLGLWKTINNWVSWAKEAQRPADYIAKHTFMLITNKNIAGHSFFTSLEEFRNTQASRYFTDFKKILIDLKGETKNTTIIDAMVKLLSLKSALLKDFLLRFTIKEVGDIKEEIKEELLYFTYEIPADGPTWQAEEAFDLLFSNLSKQKDRAIAKRRKFALTWEDFARIAARCFPGGRQKRKRLPERNLPEVKPEALEDQPFIQQMVDVGYIRSDDLAQMCGFTACWLLANNSLLDWKDKGLLLDTDVDMAEKEAIHFWRLQGDHHYWEVAKKEVEGSSIEELHDLICQQTRHVLYAIRSHQLQAADYPTSLSLRLSNGWFYELANRLEIGWYYNWDKRRARYQK